jgi:hypothetical protein
MILKTSFAISLTLACSVALAQTGGVRAATDIGGAGAGAGANVGAGADVSSGAVPPNVNVGSGVNSNARTGVGVTGPQGASVQVQPRATGGTDVNIQAPRAGANIENGQAGANVDTRFNAGVRADMNRRDYDRDDIRWRMHGTAAAGGIGDRTIVGRTITTETGATTTPTTAALTATFAFTTASGGIGPITVGSSIKTANG